MTDVTISTPVEGQTIVYNGSNWISYQPPIRQYNMYYYREPTGGSNNRNWVVKTLSEDNISDLSLVSGESIDLLANSTYYINVQSQGKKYAENIGGTWNYDHVAEATYGDKVWRTSSAHGLSVGDAIKFTDGTGIAGYTTDTIYYVISTPGAAGSGAPPSTAITLSANGIDYNTAIGGNWTFTASNDTWTTSSVHGLNVGDVVVFLTKPSGGAPSAYDIGAFYYYVITRVDDNNVKLSYNHNGTVINGTSNSSGNWTAVKGSIHDYTGMGDGTGWKAQRISMISSLGIYSGLITLGATLLGTNDGVINNGFTKRAASSTNPYETIIINIDKDFSIPDVGGTWSYSQNATNLGEWTSTVAHNLEQGDLLEFTQIGTGAGSSGSAVGFELNVVYYVNSVINSTKITLTLNEYYYNYIISTIASGGTWKAKQVQPGKLYLYDRDNLNDPLITDSNRSYIEVKYV